MVFERVNNDNLLRILLEKTAVKSKIPIFVKVKIVTIVLQN